MSTFKNLVFYEPSGRILKTLSGLIDEEEIRSNLTNNLAVLESSSIVNAADYYVKDNLVLPKGSPPESMMRFDYSTYTWVRDNNLAWYEIRKKRDQLLTDSDWTDTLSAKARLGDELYNAWQNYRQALRDVTDQADPFTITWPTKPQ